MPNLLNPQQCELFHEKAKTSGQSANRPEEGISPQTMLQHSLHLRTNYPQYHEKENKSKLFR